MRAHTLTSRGRRQGNYAAVFGLSLVPLLGGAAIVVDLGMQRVVAAQNQAAVDAAAHAASLQLDGTEEGLEAAREAATLILAKNPVGGRDVEVDVAGGSGGNRLVFGLMEDGAFTESDIAEEINAVQVDYAIDDLATPLASVAFGTDHVGVGSCSIAQQLPQDAGAVDCAIPLAIASCVLETLSEDEIGDLTFALSPAGIDNAGWARPEASPNASYLKAQIGDCTQDGEIEVGEALGLQNGVVNSAMKELAEAIGSSADTWDSETFGPLPEQASKSAVDSSDYGRVLTGSIYVFDGGDDYCSEGGGSFNGFETLVGFAPVAIYDVVTKGSAASKNIYLKVDTENEYHWGTKGGGEGIGVTYVQHAIVDEECQAG